MRPSHRLDVLLVPVDPRRAAADGLRLLEDLVEARAIAADGAKGDAARTWCPGGFARVVLDRPDPAPDGLAFHANRQGGFRVTCPATGASVVPAFGDAFAAWRAGGPRALSCPACGAAHPLEDLVYAPRAAFGPWAVVTTDAGEPALSASALAAAERRIGPFAIVLRRG